MSKFIFELIISATNATGLTQIRETLEKIIQVQPMHQSLQRQERSWKTCESS